MERDYMKELYRMFKNHDLDRNQVYSFMHLVDIIGVYLEDEIELLETMQASPDYREYNHLHFKFMGLD